MKHAMAMCAALIITVQVVEVVHAQAPPTLIMGMARAADGDSLELDGKRVRLVGIDAPELSQTCQRGGAVWACGVEAKEKLQRLVNGRRITCRVSGTDQYQRLLASCAAEMTDINETMVRTGFATAFRHYSTKYVAAETEAKKAGLGIWAGQFTAPADYRHHDEQPAPTSPIINPRRSARHRVTPTGGCVIKGNINRRGERIYHMPGMPYYEPTRAERMFCSEADAQAAGFRRAIVHWFVK